MSSIREICKRYREKKGNKRLSLTGGGSQRRLFKATKLKLYTPKSEEFREANHTHEEKNLREPGIKSYRNQL